MLSSKKYNSTNFFKHTFCEFQQIDDFKFPENSNYKSKSDSLYYYTKEGVYRKSNHWGRVANCRWKLIADNNYKNQNIVTAFAKWTGFYPINSSEKFFFISVDFKKKTAKIQSEKEATKHFLFTYSEAQKRIKQINNLLKENKWATYFDLPIKDLRFKIISKIISSDNTVEEIKRKLK
ncbi:hypothetical protein BW723_00650 [Polaribacter reichenbachii]|uniref:Uncharacterized protein n=1 Tax=Polaribacter reichenbachii TaxID=996801 RepID=A0A1B8U4S7_9FLAO|nr:hypothetical protein [Polaribacter reichenbachii]APZ44885.1 hypothetical protein BW723_00650 [Polaribacter reichenbachii]AUC18749.1 hypothetical protein BTO17_08655 [Polaribacter reichenbachii]OBY66863.1 hypothetical protein LPB301_05395 [Polaribacter reichenbachii]